MKNDMILVAIVSMGLVNIFHNGKISYGCCRRINGDSKKTNRQQTIGESYLFEIPY